MHEFSLINTLLTIAVVMTVILSTCGGLIFVERKVAAWVQDRIGPNRVGPWGLLQSLADGLKFLLKEDIIPQHVDKVLYLLAPALAVTTALLAFAVVPFGETTPPPRTPAPIATDAPLEQRVKYQAAVKEYEAKLDKYRGRYQFVIAPGLDIGILFLFAIASLNVYAIILGGWSANNKYSLLGALRSSAQIISYEIPMAMSVAGLFVMAGSLNLEWIIDAQVRALGSRPGVWFVFLQPLAFLLFMVSSFAETNRLPFDLPEAEQELVGGYHTEYSALKFAMFFLAEYTHMITTSFLMVVLFFGGWNLYGISGPESPWVVKLLVFAGKMGLFILFFMLVRWTIPRFRFDQLMGLAWKVMIPLALLNFLCVLFVMEYRHVLPLWLLTIASLVLFVGAGALALRPTATPPRRKLPQIHDQEPALVR